MVPESHIDDGLQTLEAEPEMASLDCGLMQAYPGNFVKPTLWDRDWLRNAAKMMKERNIKPELEIFNHAQLEDVLNIFIPEGLSTIRHHLPLSLECKKSIKVLFSLVWKT